MWLEFERVYELKPASPATTKRSLPTSSSKIHLYCSRQRRVVYPVRSVLQLRTTCHNKSELELVVHLTANKCLLYSIQIDRFDVLCRFQETLHYRGSEECSLFDFGAVVLEGDGSVEQSNWHSGVTGGAQVKTVHGLVKPLTGSVFILAPARLLHVTT